MPPVLEDIELAAGVGADGGGPAQRPRRQPQACGGRCPAAASWRSENRNKTKLPPKSPRSCRVTHD